MSFDLKKIFLFFAADGTYLSGAPCGSGHIHDTFIIKTAERNKDDLLLQRLNNKIFKNIPELQSNIERVTDLKTYLSSRAILKGLQIIFVTS